MIIVVLCSFHLYIDRVYKQIQKTEILVALFRHSMFTLAVDSCIRYRCIMDFILAVVLDGLICR